MRANDSREIARNLDFNRKYAMKEAAFAFESPLPVPSFGSERLSRWAQFAVGGLVIALIGFGQMVVDLPLALLLIPILIIQYILWRNPVAALIGFLFAAVGSLFKINHDPNATSPLDLAFGAILFGITLGWCLKIFLLEKRRGITDIAALFVLIFVVWTAVVGIGGMIFWNNQPTNWIREISIMIGLFTIPLLYSNYIESGSKSELVIGCTTFALWLSIMVLNIVNLQHSMAKAIYLFQTGRTGMDPSAAMFTMMLLISVWMVDRKHFLAPFFLLGIGLAGANVVLSLYRTLYIALPIGMIAVFIFSPRAERKKLLGITVLLAVMALSVVAYLYFKSHVVKVVVDGLVDRFFSTSKVTTDVSLVNRYIEWGMLWDNIIKSPILGYGYGAQYRVFDAIRMKTIMDGYSHSAFLYILFKSGIIGFFFIMGAYLLYFIKGVRLARRPEIRPYELAIVRACLGFQISVMVANSTLNIFGVKSGLAWLAITWGYFLALDKKLGSTTAESKRLVALEREPSPSRSGSVMEPLRIG